MSDYILCFDGSFNFLDAWPESSRDLLSGPKQSHSLLRPHSTPATLV
ncbi:hypothetical protein AVEN_38701-1, partial [Araneus ventricosus]